MSDTEHRRWLITGCSTGFGRFLAEAALARGDQVLLTARKPEVLADLAAQYPDTARAIKLDVTNPDDVAAAVAAGDEAFGGIDVLINNAGFSVVGAIEELEPEEYRPLYETNLFGVLNMVRAFTPQMRARGSGVLGVVSSVGGQIASPGMAHYSATKSAVEMIHEGMQGELAPFGVRTLIIEPGLFRTAIIGSLWYPKNIMPEYDHASGAVRRRMDGAVGNEPGDPVKAAKLIIEQVYDDNAPLRLPLGIGAAQRIKDKAARVTANMEALEARADNTSFDKA
ncbi:SDR family NAD(P)-dependent oxidoreductase [Phenylobacterium immobile]|uniref:SDR family NAD(P)-dependent oxidoreductase n=1 Tax=Phenylobacterium immobile TaxID=21 RepID=UPI000A72133F|nr:SDR family NAD(P)-dependent oxidoreductase [Phenylobacterium immobile]